MTQKLLLTLVMLFAAFSISAKDDKVEPLTYEIEGAGTGVQGTYLVKVTVISKKS